MMVNESVQPVLEVSCVSKRFGSIQAVADASLKVYPGELVGLIGPNGCGKSTLLGIVAGLIRPDSGFVEIEREPIPLGQYRKVSRRGIRLVPQELSLAPLDTVWESVVLGAEPRRRGLVSRRKSRAVAAEVLARLGQNLSLDSYIYELTPVERRMVMLARGLAHEQSKVLILDEPTAGLPHEEAAHVLSVIRRLVDGEHSVILVSHHIEELVTVCDRVTLMQDGRTYLSLERAEIEKDRIVKLLLAGTTNVASTGKRSGASGGAEVATLVDVHGRHLSGVSLGVARGEVLGVAGLLGSGTEELLRMITGQTQPYAGTVRVGERGVEPGSPHKALRSGVGFVSGDRSSLVIKSMTVGEHVSLPALTRLRRGPFVSARKERQWIHEGLRSLGVKGSAEAPMTSLSGGNQQRALMARWAALSVDVLVVDQPTVGVDVAGRGQILSVLASLSKDQGIVLSAEPEELAAICDRVICFRRGRVAVELKGAQVTSQSILEGIT